MKKTLQEHGKEQGRKVLEKYGPEHFSKMGKSSMQKQLAKDPSIARQRGKNGAAARKKKDPNYLAKMRAKRWGKEPPKKSVVELLLGK